MLGGRALWQVRQWRARNDVRLQEHAVGPDPIIRRRILVAANETVGGRALRGEIRKRARPYVDEVFLVCPALDPRLRHWPSDEDRARAEAHGRLDASLAALAKVGIEADGCVGDADPLRAIADTLRTFAADELIISTHPPGRSSWLERGVVERARERYPLPIAHVVVDLELERKMLLVRPAPGAAGASP